MLGGSLILEDVDESVRHFLQHAGEVGVPLLAFGAEVDLQQVQLQFGIHQQVHPIEFEAAATPHCHFLPQHSPQLPQQSLQIRIELHTVVHPRGRTHGLEQLFGEEDGEGCVLEVRLVEGVVGEVGSGVAEGGCGEAVGQEADPPVELAVVVELRGPAAGEEQPDAEVELAEGEGEGGGEEGALDVLLGEAVRLLEDGGQGGGEGDAHALGTGLVLGDPDVLLPHHRVVGQEVVQREVALDVPEQPHRLLLPRRQTALLRHLLQQQGQAVAVAPPGHPRLQQHHAVSEDPEQFLGERGGLERGGVGGGDELLDLLLEGGGGEEGRGVFELEPAEQFLEFADELALDELLLECLLLARQVVGSRLQSRQRVLCQYPMESSLGGDSVGVGVVVGPLLGEERVRDGLVGPGEVEGLALLVAVLHPPAVEQHSLHPQVLGVEEEDAAALLQLHPPQVLRHQLLEPVAPPIHDRVHVQSALLVPLLLLPPVLHLPLHLAPERHCHFLQPPAVRAPAVERRRAPVDDLAARTRVAALVDRRPREHVHAQQDGRAVDCRAVSGLAPREHALLLLLEPDSQDRRVLRFGREIERRRVRVGTGQLGVGGGFGGAGRGGRVGRQGEVGDVGVHLEEALLVGEGGSVGGLEPQQGEVGGLDGLGLAPAEFGGSGVLAADAVDFLDVGLVVEFEFVGRFLLGGDGVAFAGRGEGGRRGGVVDEVGDDEVEAVGGVALGLAAREHQLYYQLIIRNNASHIAPIRAVGIAAAGERGLGEVGRQEGNYQMSALSYLRLNSQKEQFVL